MRGGKGRDPSVSSCSPADGVSGVTNGTVVSHAVHPRDRRRFQGRREERAYCQWAPCGGFFTYIRWMGRPRAYCSDECRSAASAEKQRERNS